jgi:hypothetical protein
MLCCESCGLDVFRNNWSVYFRMAHGEVKCASCVPRNDIFTPQYIEGRITHVERTKPRVKKVVRVRRVFVFEEVVS